jgi:hypothetical protein
VRFHFYVLAIALVIGGCAEFSEARIKLVALPQRTDTVIRMASGYPTLVEEQRVLTLQQGVNRIDFSWKGVTIDPDSIRLTMLSHPDAVVLLNVSYPPGEEALVWEVSSLEAWEENARISYLLDNIDSLAVYKALADKAEQRIDFKGHLVLRNFSGENFESVRLLLPVGDFPHQTLHHEETRQLGWFDFPGVRFQKIWTFDARVLPWDPEKQSGNVGIPVSYRMMNHESSGLGKFPIPGGKIRLFQEDGHGGVIFLGEDLLTASPVGEKMEITIGESRDIVVKQRKMREVQLNLKHSDDNRIVLFDQEEEIQATIENYKDAPALMIMIQEIPGQWEMKKCDLHYTLKDAYTLEFQIPLGPGEKKELTMHYIRKNIRP